MAVPATKVDEITKIVKAETPKWVKQAREYAKALAVQTSGEKINEFLAKINGYENETQNTARKKFHISNKHLVSNLVRNVDSVWNARGGSISTELSDAQVEALKSSTEILFEGNSLSNFLKKEYFTNLLDNPQGLVYVYKDGDDFQIMDIHINNIRNYKKWGLGVKWVLFEPTDIDPLADTHKEPDGTQYFRYDDESGSYTVTKKAERITVRLDKANATRKVPAVINSTSFGRANLKMLDGGSKQTIALSPIDNELQLLESYMRKNSVKEIYEFLHMYPKFWKYAQKCPVCEGFGTINADGGGKAVCGSCGGVGLMASKNDVTDGHLLGIPEENQPKLAPDVMGYTQPDLATLDKMAEELDRKDDSIYISHWGVHNEQKSQKTATGELIDLQPKINRLNNYTDIFETVHNAIYEILVRELNPTIKGKHYTKNYGRTYLIETAEKAFKVYGDAKKEQAPSPLLNTYLEQLYAVEYRNNEMMYQIKVKLMKVEPFVHHTFEDIKDLSNVTAQDKKAKYYFNDWLMTITHDEIITKEAEYLRSGLIEFVNLKVIEDGINKEIGAGEPQGGSQD